MFLVLGCIVLWEGLIVYWGMLFLAVQVQGSKVNFLALIPSHPASFGLVSEGGLIRAEAYVLVVGLGWLIKGRVGMRVGVRVGVGDELISMCLICVLIVLFMSLI